MLGSPFLIKLRTTTLFKKRLRNRCLLPVNIAKLFNNTFFIEYLRATASGFNQKLNFFDGYFSKIVVTGLGTTMLFWKYLLSVKKSFPWSSPSSIRFFIQTKNKKAKKSYVSVSRNKAGTFLGTTRHYHILKFCQTF